MLESFHMQKILKIIFCQSQMKLRISLNPKKHPVEMIALLHQLNGFKLLSGAFAKILLIVFF